jgi:hypothetical protein
MKRIAASLIIMTALATGGYAYAQTADQSGPSQATADTLQGAKPAKPGPIDIEQFSKMDDLKGADTNGDGTLSQDEIQMLVLKRMAEREARRMERRLDMNGDGKVTLDEIQQQRAKEFAALDRNNDGKLDRKELRAAHRGTHHGHGMHHRHGMHKGHAMHGKHHKHGWKHGWHGNGGHNHHRKPMHDHQ